MTRIPTCTVLALAVASVSTVAFGQVLHVGAPGTFGTPYATMGTGGANTWETYLKYNVWDTSTPAAPVTTSNVSGNNTQASFTNQFLGGTAARGGSGGATGQVFISPTVAATGYAATAYQNTGVFYLKDAISQHTADWGSYYSDLNGHQHVDFRLAFIEDASAYVTSGNLAYPADPTKGDPVASPGKSMDPSENRGTRGIYLQLGLGNSTGVAAAGTDGNYWTGNKGSDGVGFMKVGAAATKVGDYAVTQTLINSGSAPAAASLTGGGVGVAYNSAVEVSGKMFADPINTGMVIAQVKVGNVINQFSFDPTDTRFGGTFDWQKAKVLVYTGAGNWDGDVSTQRLGVFAPGDANADGKVNLTDFGTLKTNYMKTDMSWSGGDFTQDGKVNLSDFSVLKTQYMKPVTGPTLAASMAVQDGPAVLTLVVDPATGDVKLSGSSASICGYEIDSASGSLVPGNWNSLSAQGNANYFGGGDATSLSEASMNPQSLDGLVDIGNVFKVGGQQDLVFSYLDSTGSQVFSTVSYVAVPEPAALGVLAVASIGLITRRRRAA